MAEIYDYNVAASSNNDAPPDGFPENMQYSQVNNAAREVMAVIARYIQALGAVSTAGTGSAYTLTIDQEGTPARGRHYIITAHVTSAAGATLSINGGSALELRRSDNRALSAGALVTGGTYLIIHTGSAYALFANRTGAEIKTAYEANADTNAFTDAQVTKLAGIEDDATADQTNAEIKTAYEANADTNAFTDAQVTKLAGIGNASETQRGLVEQATMVEALAGTDAARFVTPAGVRGAARAAADDLITAAAPRILIRGSDRTGNGANVPGTNDLARDPDLSRSLAAGSYLIDGSFTIQRPPLGVREPPALFGLRFQFSTSTTPSNSTLTWTLIDDTGGARSGRAAPFHNVAVAASNVSTATTVILRLTGFIILAAAAVVDFSWGRVSSITNVRTGSFLRYTRDR